MSEELFLKKVGPVWDELQKLLERSRRSGPRSLTAEELSRLDKLYRRSTVHLAQLRSRTSNQALTERLNRLVTMAHSTIYLAPRVRPLQRVGRFYLTGFPRAVARSGRYHLAAALLFACGGLVAFFTFPERPEAAYALLAPGELRLPGSSTAQLQRALRSGRTDSETSKLLFSSALFTHNTKVGIAAFTSGVVFGIPTVFLMILNGAMLGTFVSIHHQRGIVAEVWAWLLPHGVTEILAVWLCGGAGLMLGMAVIRPRYRTRREALYEAGREALQLVLGVVPMFLTAGFVEGFLRQSELDAEPRLMFAALTVLLWTLYFGTAASLEKRERTAGIDGRAVGPSAAPAFAEGESREAKPRLGVRNRPFRGDCFP